MKDVMIDLETLGNGENKCVIQVGACYFDRTTGEIGETFKRNIDAKSAVQAGFQMDAQTVYWWLAQSDAARASIIQGPLLPIRDAFNDLNTFLAPAKSIWSHATFDFVTIMETYRKLDIKPLFSYKAARDIRTLIDLMNVSISPVPRTGVHHDGLDDSIHQVKYCMEAFKRLDELKSTKALVSYLKGSK